MIVWDKDRPDTPYIIVELKKPEHLKGKRQLKSYCHATGSPLGIWTNGEKISYYHRKDPNYFEEITDIPKVSQTLRDVLSERFTLKDLILKDRIVNERKSLKDIILEMEDEVLANAGVDVFEEVFKLIFIKLYDEFSSSSDKSKIDYHIDQVVPEEDRNNYEVLKSHLKTVQDSQFRCMEFRNSGRTDSELKETIQQLFPLSLNIL